MSMDLGKGVRLEGNKIIYTSPGGTVTVKKRITKRKSPAEINIQKEWTVAPGLNLGIHGQAKGKDKKINIGGTFTFQEGTKDKTIRGQMKEWLKKSPRNRRLKQAIAAMDSEVDYTGFLTAKEKKILGIE